MNDAMPDSLSSVERAWDGLAEEYHRSIGPAGARRALAAIELAVVLREIAEREHCHVLDAGGGPGYHAIKLAERGHSVTVVDISARMLAIARRAAKRAGVQDRMATVKADVRSVDVLMPSSFDFVMSCGTVVSDCGSPVDALLVFAKVLRPGGKACFSVRGLDSVPEREPERRALFWGEGTRVVRGHQAFDWHLFSRLGLQRLCDSAGLSLVCAVPVGCEVPPDEETDRALEEYVRLHLAAGDDAKALVKAAEMMAVAQKRTSSP